MDKSLSISLTVDAVVFGYTPERALGVLLIRRSFDPFGGHWALPGGFVRLGETLETAVHRELAEESGLTLNYLEQLYTFGEPGRDPRGQVVSVAYMGLVKPEKYTLSASTDASDARWFPVKELPPLAFDHANIIETALRRLRAKATYEPIGFELLEEKFPFSHLEHLYSTLLDRPVGRPPGQTVSQWIDRRNFRKKIMQFGFLEELPEKSVMPGSGRPGNLFRFLKEKYLEAKGRGIVFEI